MAVCKWCSKEMSGEHGADSCDDNVKVDIRGEVYDPIRYGEESDEWQSERCHDCNVAKGGIHHPGCDVEECPKCYGQLISCGCLGEDENEEAN